MPSRDRKNPSLLSKLLDHEGIHDKHQRRSAATYLGNLTRDPGDLQALGYPYLVGMAVAMMRTHPSPGWLPVVQADAMALGKVAKSL